MKKISLNKVLYHIAKSEVHKLSLDVKDAEYYIKEIVLNDNNDDEYSQLIRNSILGITRFPIIAHLPNATWYQLNVTIKELSSYYILNETSWKKNYGTCVTVYNASTKYIQLSNNDNQNTKIDQHTARINKVRDMNVNDRVIVGVSSNRNRKDGITILDGNHRSIRLVVEHMLLNQQSREGGDDDDDNDVDDETVTLLLGLSDEFVNRQWKGSFYCCKK